MYSPELLRIEAAECRRGATGKSARVERTLLALVERLESRATILEGRDSADRRAQMRVHSGRVKAKFRLVSSGTAAAVRAAARFQHLRHLNGSNARTTRRGLLGRCPDPDGLMWSPKNAPNSKNAQHHGCVGRWRAKPGVPPPRSAAVTTPRALRSRPVRNFTGSGPMLPTSAVERSIVIFHAGHHRTLRAMAAPVITLPLRCRARASCVRARPRSFGAGSPERLRPAHRQHSDLDW
jgi:hypothetical protein